MTKLAPRQPGWQFFRGIRHGARYGEVQHLNEPVKIVEYVYADKRELVALLAGRATPVRLQAFDGEWSAIDATGL